MLALRDRDPLLPPAHANLNAQSISKTFQCSFYTENSSVSQVQLLLQFICNFSFGMWEKKAKHQIRKKYQLK